MPEPRGHDWRAIVEKDLAGIALPASRREEICRELAAHLEDTYWNLRDQLTDEEAVRAALATLGQPHIFTRDIRELEQEESMTQNTRAIWIPGLTTLVAYWTVAIALGVYLMRTGAFFQPGTVLLGGAIVSLSLGALGAGWARANGATKWQRAVVSIFPVFLSLAGFVVGPALSLMQGTPMMFPFHGDVNDVLLKGVLFPAAGLFLGALPFLRNGREPHFAAARS